MKTNKTPEAVIEFIEEIRTATSKLTNVLNKVGNSDLTSLELFRIGRELQVSEQRIAFYLEE